MGQGGFITLVNATKYDWNRTYEHSYQMNAWSFPDTVPAGQSVRVYVEWDQSIIHHTSDDGGETTYSLAGTSLDFQIQARAGNGFDLRVAFTNLATPGNPQGSVLDLGWNHDGCVNFILAGQEGAFTSSNPPTAWMQGNLGMLGSCTLRQLCMPGSHDAGMSVFTSGTAFAANCNTLTQTQGVLGQLTQGARYFDIRPVISAGLYYTGHYGYIDKLSSWQGANGQSIQDIIHDVNAYTANNAELVILKLSHDLNTDVGNSSYRPFTQDEWNGLLAAMTGLDHLYVAPDPTTVDLSALRLGQFIGGGQAAVVVLVEPSDSGISLGSYATQGFYTPTNLSIYDSYANSNDLGAMSSDQLSKMKAQRTNQDSPCFLLSWTLTQDATQASTCALGVASSILDLAALADPALPNGLWPAITGQCYPNILYTDNVSTSVAAALALAVNTQAVAAANPLPSGSPYIPAGSYLLTAKDVSVTLQATCTNLQGQGVPATFTYGRERMATAADLCNMNGNLAFVVSPGGVLNNPFPSGSPFIPCGTYLQTSKDVSVTLSATCQDKQGNWVPSTVTYTAAEAATMWDISNQNGQLCAARNQVEAEAEA